MIVFVSAFDVEDHFAHHLLDGGKGAALLVLHARHQHGDLCGIDGVVDYMAREEEQDQHHSLYVRGYIEYRKKVEQNEAQLIYQMPDGDEPLHPPACQNQSKELCPTGECRHRGDDALHSIVEAESVKYVSEEGRRNEERNEVFKPRFDYVSYTSSAVSVFQNLSPLKSYYGYDTINFLNVNRF